MKSPTHFTKLLITHFMKPLAAPLLLLLSFAATDAQQSKPPAQGAGDDDVVRVSTSLVTVPVSVSDRQGRFVPDLTRERFKLFEDGVEQEIAFFEPADKSFTVALLLDTSESTRFKLRDIQAAAIAFLDQLRPEDRVIVISFGKSASVLSEPTSDRAALRAAVLRARPGGSTSLYDAVELAARERLRRISGRKAVVLFTDGVDTSSGGATYESSLRDAEELDALAYVIRYDTYSDATQATAGASSLGGQRGVLVTAKGELLSDAYKRAGIYLGLLADKTGGRLFYADTPDNLSRTFARVAAELREQYSLGYYPKRTADSTGERHIRVRVDAKDLSVHARKSYAVR
ncbi:MAG TPA: VWA domain-containing protein [Pyrinomonadaceae bacterium]|nr:VWA domain-containing protein [Pyrinomonadaceae bacterium]